MHARHYETLLLLHPDLEVEELEQAKQKFIDIIEKMEGRLVKVDDWGRRRLAYPVKKMMYGRYILMDYMGTPACLTEFERNLRIDERIFKHLTLVLDKKYTEEKYQKDIQRLAAEQAEREARDLAAAKEASAPAEDHEAAAAKEGVAEASDKAPEPTTSEPVESEAAPAPEQAEPVVEAPTGDQSVATLEPEEKTDQEPPAA